MKIRWLEEAISDLRVARSFIHRTNPLAARAVARRIRESVTILREYPTAGRGGRVRNTRELVVSGTPYIVAYRIRADTVQILRVMHAARKWPDH